MTQGWNNLSRYQQMLIDTAPKTADYYADKIARGFTGGKDYMPKQVISKIGQMKPIKGLGGIAGAGLLLSDALNDALRWAWKESNLNTMSPSQRNAMLRAAGRENEIANYTRQEDTLDDLPMSPLSRAVAGLVQRGMNKAVDISKSSGNGLNNGNANVNSNNKNTGTNTERGYNKSTINVARQLANEIVSQPQEPQQQQLENLQAINDYMSQLKEINQPYIDALQNYIGNYNDMFNRQQMSARRLRDLSAITGDPTWYQSAKDFNPVVQEANRIAAIKQLQDAQAGDINAINEVMGNMAIAKEMDLPYEAAFANKNLLTALTMRDKTLTNKEIARLNNEAKMQIALQNYANRLAVQSMRNQGAMDRAILNAQTFGFSGFQPAPGLNARGQSATSQDLTMEQILQQAAKQNR